MRSEIKDLLDEMDSLESLNDEECLSFLVSLLDNCANPWAPTLIASNNEFLPPELQGIMLTKEEEREVVNRIQRRIVIASKTEWPTLIYALSHSSPEVYIEPLIMTIHDLSPYFDEESAYQAIIGLDNIRFHDYKGKLMRKYGGTIEKTGLLEFLVRWNIQSIADRMGSLDKVIERVKQASDH